MSMPISSEFATVARYRPDAATLRALHIAHLETVPFENLDIHFGHPILLDEEAASLPCCARSA
jgi:arylamine N-acetyltransferase